VGLEPGIYETSERSEFPYTPIVKVIESSWWTCV